MNSRYQLMILTLLSILLIFSGVYMLSTTSSTKLVQDSRNSLAVTPPPKDCSEVKSMLKSVKKCSNLSCVERLSNSDMAQHDKCVERMQTLSGQVLHKENGCYFLCSDSRPPVALISFPGSGNTWVRQLLEAMSGICTGSTMCDMSLRFAGFTGESITSGSVLVVKTHATVPNWTMNPLRDGSAFQSAILLIRNPFDALVSEWSRRVANNFRIETIHLHAHTREVSGLYFGWNRKWDSFVHYQARRWQEIIHHWLINGKKNGKKVLVVHYEALRRNTHFQLQRMLNFLGLGSSKTLSQDFNMFHRKHKKEFEPYTKKQKQYIFTVIKNTIRELEQSQMKSEANLTQYLHDFV